MGRISRQQMFIEMARVAAKRATCFRLNVGALVTYHNSPVSVGWNGAEPGAPHCAGNDCAGIVPGNCGTLHAEVNALKKAEGLLPSGEGVDLYTTHSPCRECVLYLMKGPLQIKRLFFEIPYRDPNPISMLYGQYKGPVFDDDGMMRRLTEVYEVTPAGYIVEFFSRKVVELP